ncbi:MAG: 50S ribosomal protein L25 [Thermoleophilia bacterium]|nr:50S ribosomal protein L25 [Thermoleophilia bacterium]
MDTIKLSVHEREETGNGPARRLRAKGTIPGVSYSKGKAATPISIDLEEFKAALTHGHNTVLELDFGKGAKGAKGKAARYAVVKQMQFHPTKRHLLHVDLHEVDLAVEIEAAVAIEPVGVPAGLADGGIIDWERREVMVRALPSDVPQALELDVSGLHIGHHLSVAALAAPDGVTIVDDPETILVALVPPRVEQAPAAEEVEEAVEPEVIGSDTAEE